MRVHYFSGTGNARRVSLWLAEEAARRKSPGDVVEIGGGEPRLSGYMNGFVFPVHGFTISMPMLRFLWRLPRSNRRTRVFVAAVTGAFRLGRWHIPGWEGSGLYLAVLMLWAKGYRPIGARAFHFTPENWTALVPGPGEESAVRLMSATHGEVRVFADALCSGKFIFSGKLSACFGALFLPLSLAYLLFARFLLPKLMFASSRCTHCGLCAQLCPVAAIEIKDGRPFWTFRCQSCMRCANFCPSRAIQASHLVALVLIFGAAPLAHWMFSHLPAASGEWRGLVAQAASAVVMIGMLALFYRVWFVALRWKPVNLFFEYTTLTRWYHRYREPQTSAAELKH